MTSTFIRHLNFFEEKDHGTKAIFSFNYLLILVIVLLMAACAAGISLLQKRQIESLREHLAAVSAQNVEMQSHQLQTKQEKLSTGTLKEVLGDPILWSALIKTIVKNIPEPIRLSQLSGNIGSKRILVLKGSSPFLLPIFRLKDNFLELKECEKASLVSIDQGEGTNSFNQISFQLECTLL
jgi:hypothetical protein